MKKLFLILAIILLFPGSPSAIKLSSMGDDEETLDQYMKKPMESDIEGSRRQPSQAIPERAITSNQNINRPASEDKSPMQADNILDMELPYWEGFEFSPWNYQGLDIPSFANPPAIYGYAQPGIPNFKYPEEPYAEDEELPGMVQTGCGLSAPSVIIAGWGKKCTDPYIVTIPIYHGIIIGITIVGPGKLRFTTNGPFYTITVTPYSNIQSGAKITVKVTTLTVLDGKKYYGSCEATTTFENCSECDDCMGAEPTIFATGETIANNGTQTLYVNSSGTACPPYFWSVAQSGYTITGHTHNDFDLATLKAPDGACGVATVTVTDSCGVTDTFEIRNTNGVWAEKAAVCGLPGSDYTNGILTYCGDLIGGANGYRLCNRIYQTKKQYQKIRRDALCDLPCDNYGFASAGTCLNNVSGYISCVCYPTSGVYWYINEAVQYWEWECP